MIVSVTVLDSDLPLTAESLLASPGAIPRVAGFTCSGVAIAVG